MTVTNSKANGSTQPLINLAVERLATLRNSELSDAVYEKATLCLIDYLGAVVSGLSAPWSPSLLRYAQKAASSGRGEAWAVGLDQLVSAELAAFTNAAVGHR